MRKRHIKTNLILILLILLAPAIDATIFLKPGDRIVFYGDSITEQRLYTRYLQQYLLCRYPDLNLKFYNAGWGGDIAPGGLRRMDRDVLALNPTVVSLFFGMNDGGYRSVEEYRIQNYHEGMDGLIKGLQDKQVRVVVMTPGCVDPDMNPDLKNCNYNKTLEALGKTTLDLAQQYHCSSVDVMHPMLDYQGKQKEIDKHFTMIPDAIHPNSFGHLVMAQSMLEGFGAEPMAPLGAVNIKTKASSGLRMLSSKSGKIVLETIHPVPVPFWFEKSAYTVMKDTGFLTKAGQKLTIIGLPSGTYEMNIDGVIVGRMTAEELASGYYVPGFYSKRGKQLHDLIMRKEEVYFGAWRRGMPPNHTWYKRAWPSPSGPVSLAASGVSLSSVDWVYCYSHPNDYSGLTTADGNITIWIDDIIAEGASPENSKIYNGFENSQYGVVANRSGSKVGASQSVSIDSTFSHSGSASLKWVNTAINGFGNDLFTWNIDFPTLQNYTGATALSAWQYWDYNDTPGISYGWTMQFGLHDFKGNHDLGNWNESILSPAMVTPDTIRIDDQFADKCIELSKSLEKTTITLTKVSE